MKTALVIFTNKKITDHIRLRTFKQYTFNINEEEISEGDFLKSDSYETSIQVVKVLEEHYLYYNRSTGELANELKNAYLYPISDLILDTRFSHVVHCKKIQ